MKVCQITNYFSQTGGGLVTAVSGLTRAIESDETKSVIFGHKGGDPVKSWNGIDTREIDSTSVFGVHFGGSLRSQLDDFCPDLVHAHGLWLTSSLTNSRWCRANSRPYMISPHGMLDPWALKNSWWKKKIVGYLFEREHLERANCLHALCESEMTSARAFDLKKPICVIPNGVDLPEKLPSGLISPWEKSHGKKVMLFLGRIHPKKGLPLLLSAWGRLKVRMPKFNEDWCLKIAGWSEVGHQAELEAQVRELNLHNDVEFIGPLHGDAKVSALQYAEAFILPSYSEGLPMSVLEAWSYQLPSLITPECNLPDGFEADAAIRVETYVDSITAGLMELHEMSDSQRAGIGQRAFRLVESKFTWPEIAKQMVAVYEWMLGGGDAPSTVRFE